VNHKTTPTIILGVTGCIAAYKACELARLLMAAGCRVKVVMTENATRFVGQTTFRALTREPVAVSLWDEAEASVHHVSLAQEADLLLIAPATANVMAKLASGRSDDLLSTTALATRAPVIVAPAMNDGMWEAAATQANVLTLEQRGVTVVGPETGALACGDTGVGRLAPLDHIVSSVLSELNRTTQLVGVNVLITSGPTQEMIDPVRFISNGSSGKTGYAIAIEARQRGASVTVVSGPTQLPAPTGIELLSVESARQMEDAVAACYGAADVVIATAAVSDFRPADVSDSKVKKESASLTLALVRNPDILAGLGARKDGRLLVGFAAETDDVIAHAKAKLESKNLDVVVANDVSEGHGFGSDDNAVWFVTSGGVEELTARSKRQIAAALWDRIGSDATNCAANRKNGVAT